MGGRVDPRLREDDKFTAKKSLLKFFKNFISNSIILIDFLKHTSSWRNNGINHHHSKNILSLKEGTKTLIYGIFFHKRHIRFSFEETRPFKTSPWICWKIILSVENLRVTSIEHLLSFFSIKRKSTKPFTQSIWITTPILWYTYQIKCLIHKLIRLIVFKLPLSKISNC